MDERRPIPDLLGERGAAAQVVAELVRQRTRVPYREMKAAVRDRAILVARARGLVRVVGVGVGAELVPGSGVSMFEPDWHDEEWRRGRWSGRS